MCALLARKQLDDVDAEDLGDAEQLDDREIGMAAQPPADPVLRNTKLSR
jgi:hypothetical protein